MNTIKRKIENEGYAIVSRCVSEKAIQVLQASLDGDRHGIRNLFCNDTVRAIAVSDEIRKHVTSVLGTGCFAVRGIFFNKNRRSNWKVAWHQDCVIAVREKLDISGWGPWSIKSGIFHVRPGPAVLRQMLAVRIHLDDCGALNGPLRVIPGSHRDGILSHEEISSRSKESAVGCTALRGDVLLMSPLILHSSSPASNPSNRRVVHLEFAAKELPHGLEWHERVF